MSRLHAYFSLGGVLGVVLGTLLVDRVRMLTHVLVVIVTTVAGMLAGRLLLPDSPLTEVQEAGQPAQTSCRRAGISSAALLGLLCFLGVLSERANYDCAALYFCDVLGQAGGNAGIGYAAFAVTMTLGRWHGEASGAGRGKLMSRS